MHRTLAGLIGKDDPAADEDVSNIEHTRGKRHACGATSPRGENHVVATNAGGYVRAIRLRRGLTTRYVDQASRTIAAAEGRGEYVVSHARLIQIESGESTPSIYKLYSLSAIYGVSLSQLLSPYVNPGQADGPPLGLAPPNAGSLSPEAKGRDQRVEIPFQFSATIDPASVIAEIIDVWGHVPTGLLQQLSLRTCLWGYIGLGDYTMYPLLRPGSLVQIDQNWTVPSPRLMHSEFDRPIYFVEIREGYICSWCEFHANQLVCVPHPLSPVPIRRFVCPSQAEVIGRVTAIAGRLVDRPSGRLAGPIR